MTPINNNAYNANDRYYSPNAKLNTISSASVDPSVEKEKNPPGTNQDKVTLSKGVATARTREAMGLAPTGRLKLGDIETAAENQEEIVQSKLNALINDLGVDENQKISFSLDAKNNIAITEKFPQKAEMEKALNEDVGFSLAFNRLSANNEILDYTKDLQTRRFSLVDMMNSNSDSDWNNILSLASDYSKIKSSNNSLESLLGISKNEKPYTFTHEPVTEPARPYRTG
jgi:hypothetical protein